MASISLICALLFLGFYSVSGLICWECENVFSQEECLQKGAAVLCKPTQNMCHLSLRHGGWGDYPLIEKSCKSLVSCGDNYLQNLHSAWAIEGDMVQCNEYYPSSVCRCCCGTDLCNQDKTSCGRAESIDMCSSLQAPNHGSMTCYNGFAPLSSCRFSCDRDYVMDGEEYLTCDRFGNWNYDAPQCRVITCPPPPMAPEFGGVRCSNGIKLRSKCRFSCEEGYKIRGSANVKCIDDLDGDGHGVWSRLPPVCTPLQCPEQRPLRHGTITCTDTNYVRSNCTFECDAELGYKQHPPAGSPTLMCQRNELWDNPRPCCTLPCPPFAVMDFVIVLDSSSSVGLENWRKMTEFVARFMSDFSVRDDATHFAALRYNRDIADQVLFTEFPNSLEGLIAGLMGVTYDGSGTNTGKALNYTVDVLLKIGNRPLARDVVLLITDGASQDDVTIPAKRVRDSGALIYVLPIRPQRGQLDLDEIADIAGPGNEQNILTDALEMGFDALDEDFAARLTGLLCSDPCFNPLHGHPDDARNP